MEDDDDRLVASIEALPDDRLLIAYYATQAYRACATLKGATCAYRILQSVFPLKTENIGALSCLFADEIERRNVRMMPLPNN